MDNAETEATYNTQI